MPRFTVVIPAYGNADYLPDCLDSVEAQTCADWEAVVVNDASPDATSEVAHGYARRDARFRVVDRTANGGLHLARRSGAAMATGDYVLFLDADDILAAPDVLERLDAYAKAHGDADIIRFGLVATPANGMSAETARSFSAWCTMASEPLEGEDIVRAAFLEGREGGREPWHVTHRLFRRDLMRRALACWPRTRLERAEDATEYFIAASLARRELSACSVVGYRYRMGTGVTNARALPARRFVAETRARVACYEAALAYARGFARYDLVPYALDFKDELLECIGNDWHERVPDDQKRQAASQLCAVVGEAEADAEFYRFVRDRAYAFYDTGTLPGSDDDPLFLLVRIAREHAGASEGEGREPERCARMRAVAEGHLNDLKARGLRIPGEPEPGRDAQDEKRRVGWPRRRAARGAGKPSA